VTLNNQNNPQNDSFLAPLKKRPDMEPDPLFIANLRNKLTSGDRHPQKHWGAILSICTAMLLFFVLAQSYLSKDEVQVIDRPAATQTYQIESLIHNQPAYLDIQAEINTATQHMEGANTFIIYLEAMRIGDITEVKKWSFSPEAEAKLEELSQHYQNINYDTLKIAAIIPSQAEPTFEIQLEYELLDTIAGQRTLYLNLIEEKTINIFEP
jgi:hypothetical protein